MKTALITGFDAFGGDKTNPSGDAVGLLAETWDAPFLLVTACLPVEFARAGHIIRTLVDEHSPDVVIATGLAAGRATLTPERVAINLADARIPDNRGDQPRDRSIDPAGPAAFFSTIPVRTIVEAMIADGVPASLSTTAGRFVCNSVMYELLQAVEHRPGVCAGFIHVPCSPALAEGTAHPSLPVAVVARGLGIAARLSLAAAADRTDRTS